MRVRVRDEQSPLWNIQTLNISTELNPIVLCNQTRFSGSVLRHRLETRGITSFSFANLFTASTAVKFHLDSVSNSSHIILCQFKCMRGNNRNFPWMFSMTLAIPYARKKFTSYEASIMDEKNTRNKKSFFKRECWISLHIDILIQHWKSTMHSIYLNVFEQEIYRMFS